MSATSFLLNFVKKRHAWKKRMKGISLVLGAHVTNGAKTIYPDTSQSSSGRRRGSPFPGSVERSLVSPAHADRDRAEKSLSEEGLDGLRPTMAFATRFPNGSVRGRF